MFGPESGPFIFGHQQADRGADHLRFTIPAEKGNQAYKDGSLGKTMETIMKKLKPEAAYFAPTDGKRGGMIFFDLADPSQIIEVVEPFFSSFNAAVELIPVMNGDDLRKGMAKNP